MGFIIAFQPDSEQAATLLQMLGTLPDVKVALVRSKDAALAAVDEQVPDLMLVHSFINPADEEHLEGYLRAHPRAHHVQVLTIPPFQVYDAPAMSPPRHRPFAARRRSDAAVQRTSAHCQPGLFGSDVAEYLSLSEAGRYALYREPNACEPAQAIDRRRTPRWGADELIWLVSVALSTGESAALVNFSSGGALVRTEQRPGAELFSTGVRESAPQRGLAVHLASGRDVRIGGRVIRCDPRLNETARRLYEVAFRFDEPAEKCLPIPAQGPPLLEGSSLRLVSSAEQMHRDSTLSDRRRRAITDGDRRRA